jgi:plastocyanin
MLPYEAQQGGKAMKRTRWLLVAVSLGGLGLALQAAAQTAANVTISNFRFAPETISVSGNAPITWTNNDGAPHQVVVGSKKLSTPVMNKGQSAQLRIAEPGSYDYICGIHPTMKGRISVK